MPEIPPKELLDQLEQRVELLEARSEQQWRWLEENDFPVSELQLGLDDVWPSWGGRLSETRMIDAQDERLMDELKAHIKSIRDTEQRRVFTHDGLREAAEWEVARRLATAALESLKRPISQKRLDH